MKRMPVNALIVDDSAYSRFALRRLLESIPGVNVISTAVDGIDGYRQALRLMPDLIMLDLEMPNMDGFAFLRMLKDGLKGGHGTSVIVVSGNGCTHNAFKALELGAIDFIEKPDAHPSEKIFSIKGELARIIGMLPGNRRGYPSARPVRPAGKKGSRFWPEAVAVGASTGGPGAVSSLVKSLPADFNYAFVVSVHMPQWVTAPFVERLAAESGIDVKAATDGCSVDKGVVLIAPGGYHMSFVRSDESVYARLMPQQWEDLYAPSIDVMFSSAAEVWGGGLAGIVMTGMGNDGREGVINIKDKGGYVLAESRESSLISSMPDAAISTGRVDEVLTISAIGDWVRERAA